MMNDNMMKSKLSRIRVFAVLALVAGLVLFSASGMAGEAVNWQLGMQEAASPVAHRLHSFHNLLLSIITAIALFVLVLLIYVVVRFNAHASPKPKQFSHNLAIEVLWTVIPVVILIIIAIPSFKLLYYSDRAEEPEMTLKVTGYQWYWGYEYPDQDGLSFNAYMLPEDEITPDQRRLLSTDNVVVLPVDTNIQILVTAADVLHAFTVPALGFKVDAIPGRFNETWVRIEKPGTYYGQCSELCGKDHAFMPVEIKAVSKEEFERWIVRAKKKFAYNAQNSQDGIYQLASSSYQFTTTEGR